MGLMAQRRKKCYTTESYLYTDVWNMDHRTTPGEKAYAEFLNEHYKSKRHRGLWACSVFHDLPPEESRPYVKASSAVQFLDEERPRDKPFCLCLSFSDPHVPHMAPRKFKSIYSAEKMKLYSAWKGELEEKARRFLIEWRAQQADIADRAGMRYYMAVYYAMISWVDEQVGHVIDALKAQGLEENTILRFLQEG